MVEEKAESEMNFEFGSNFKWKFFLFLLFLTMYVHNYDDLAPATGSFVILGVLWSSFRRTFEDEITFFFFIRFY